MTAFRMIPGYVKSTCMRQRAALSITASFLNESPSWRHFDIRSIAFDRYHMDYLEPELLDEGVTVPLVPHGQGFGKSAESGFVDAAFNRAARTTHHRERNHHPV